jgi:hypothetical protein
MAMTASVELPEGGLGGLPEEADSAVEIEGEARRGLVESVVKADGVLNPIRVALKVVGVVRMGILGVEGRSPSIAKEALFGRG